MYRVLFIFDHGVEECHLPRRPTNEERRALAHDLWELIGATPRNIIATEVASDEQPYTDAERRAIRSAHA